VAENDRNDTLILSSEFQSEVDAQENLLRPKYLKDSKDKRASRRTVCVHQGRPGTERCLGPCLLDRTPGLGKTTLASIIANEMETEIRMTSAPALEKPKDLAGILTNVTEGSVFFIDEIHRLSVASKKCSTSRWRITRSIG
jgi:Holliday junction DNA helicase RuvB